MLEFELIGGLHDQGDGKVYRRGDHVWSEVELDRACPGKFRRLSESVPVEQPVQGLPVAVKENPSEQEEFDDLESMTLTELRQFAEGEEIDLKNAKKRADVLRAIREAVE